jgi:hypothetical protein
VRRLGAALSVRRLGAGLSVAGLLVLAGLAALSLVSALSMSGCTGNIMPPGASAGAAGASGAAGTPGAGGVGTAGGAGGAAAPLVGRVPRRMSANQVRATFLELTGVAYTGLATVRDPDAPTGETKNPAADLLDAYGSALGRADYNYVVHENLEPGISFSKLVLDAARFTCGQAALRELGGVAAPPHLLLKAAPTDTLPAGEAALRANIAALMVRFWGQVIPPDDAEVTRVLEVFRAASTAPAWMAPDKTMRPAGTVADGWRVVCIALASSPEFYVY